MLLEETDRYTLHRQGRYLLTAFTRPHRVLSTCRVNGGLREDLTHLVNHQSCEGVGHTADLNRTQCLDLDDYHVQACLAGRVSPTTTALMGTAANMQCAVLARAAHADLTVTVVATAGVLGNATRAGDPAHWHEHTEGSQPVSHPDDPLDPNREHPEPPSAGANAGTIVTLVFINQPCTPACLVRAATLVTEGKSAAVLDLRMPSLQSPGLATGTGTDQLAIAAPLARAGEWERHWAGGHNTLGELLGRATHEAVTRCLLLQNGVCPELRRSICGALGRFGCDEAALRASAQAELSSPIATLFERNLLALIHDPQSAAVAFAMAEIVDLARIGVLHAEIAREAILNQAALLAAAVALTPERFADFRERLQTQADLPPGRLAALAVVTGFERKWS